MKFHLLILFICLFSCRFAWAQVKSFTQSAPISISGDGLAGKKGEDEVTMRAREELSRSRVKKAEESKEDEAKPDQVIEKHVTEQKEEQIKPEPKHEPEAKPKPESRSAWTQNLSFEKRPSFIEFSWGSLFSSWSDVSSELKDNSWLTGFTWGRFFHPKLSSSIGIEFVHPQEQQYVAEEVRLFQISGTLKHHHKVSKDFSVVSGGSLLIADWNVRKKVSTANSQEVYQSYGSGSGVGLRPEASLRWHLSNSSHLDLKSSWTQYFGSPQSDFGGLGLALQLHVQL
jgi:hypothetical protein